MDKVTIRPDFSEITWSSFDGSNPEQWPEALKHSLLESYIDVMILRDLIDNGYYRRVQVNPDIGMLLENRVCRTDADE